MAPVEKGRDWGEHAPLPSEGVIVRTDADARAVVEAARRAGEQPPPLGLAGGDLCRTLGGTGDEARLRSDAAMTFAVDLGQALVDGRLYYFVAHLVARTRFWTRVVTAMNAEFLGRWDVAPRAHPGDGRLDVFDARLRLEDLPAVRRRLPAGDHLPHPRIAARRVPAAQFEFERGLSVRLDGAMVGRGRKLSVRLEPAALTVHV